MTDEAIDAAAGRHDPWRARRTVTLEMLAERRLIALPPDTGIRTRLETACAAKGHHAQYCIRSEWSRDLADLAERGLGAAILPESVSRTRAGLAAIAIVPELRGRLVLAWRSAGPMSPAGRVLVDMARKLLQRESADESLGRVGPGA